MFDWSYCKWPQHGHSKSITINQGYSCMFNRGSFCEDQRQLLSKASFIHRTVQTLSWIHHCSGGFQCILLWWRMPIPHGCSLDPHKPCHLTECRAFVWPYSASPLLRAYETTTPERSVLWWQRRHSETWFSKHDCWNMWMPLNRASFDEMFSIQSHAILSFEMCDYFCVHWIDVNLTGDDAHNQ